MAEMDRKKTVSSGRRKRMLWSCIIFWFLMSVSFLLMPVSYLIAPNGQTLTEANRTITVLTAVLFYSSLVGVIAVTVRITQCRRKNPEYIREYGGKETYGVLSFFRNKPAAAADIVMILSVFGLVLIRARMCNLYCQYAGSALLLFSFGMHCLFNSANYIYLTALETTKEGVRKR